MHWGVDSARTPNSTAVDGSVCYDSVTSRATAAPEFWGRYIGGNYSLTAGEITYLHGVGCKILVAYNGTSNDSTSVQGDIAEGRPDAANAITAAIALGVPTGTAIYADIEGSWTPSANWMRGWATAVAAANFTPGMYCDPTPGSAFDQAYCVAAPLEPAVAASFLWSMEPEPNPQCMAAGLAPAFGPKTPTCGGNVLLWQYTIDCWQDTLGANQGIDMDLALDAALAVMW